MQAELGMEKKMQLVNLEEETTKIHIAADAYGHPIDFEITGGEVHDIKIADKLIEKVGSAEHFIADKGYDSENIREQAKAAKMIPVIPRKSNSRKPNPEFDAHLYTSSSCRKSFCEIKAFSQHCDTI
jgi:transposase